MSENSNGSEYIYAQTVNLVDQRPLSETGIMGQSPLDHVGLPEIAQTQKADNGSVFLSELPLLGHIVIRGQLSNENFAQGVKKALGVSLPNKLSMVNHAGISIRWISPDEWLVIVPGEKTFEIQQLLAESIQGHCAIVDVSGGQTVLQISGEKVRQVLKKTIPLDIHDSVFPVNKVVTTVFAKTQAVVCRMNEDTWQLVIRRSFSDYVWLWLQDCCAEFSLIIRDSKEC